MQLKEIILNAIQLIKEKGWTQHQYVSPAGEICASEAINKAILNINPEIESPIRWGLRIEINEQIRKINPAVYSIVPWNDRSTTTKEEVLDTLQKTANTL